MNKDEALNVALEALGDIVSARSRGFGFDYVEGYASTTIKQLHQALAEPLNDQDYIKRLEDDFRRQLDELSQRNYELRHPPKPLAEPPNSATHVVEPVAFEDWLKSQHGDPEEIGFLQALRVAYYAGADSRTAPPKREWVSLTDEEAQANSKLIAAAPDLLEACEALLELVEILSPIEGDTHRKAQRAIAKATGE